MNINSYRPFIVISAQRPDMGEDEAYTAFEGLCSYVTAWGMSFVSGVGHTKEWGTERVCLVFPEPGDIVDTALTLRDKFKQESVLVVDQFRNVLEYRLGNTSKLLGIWRESKVYNEHTSVNGRYFADGRSRSYTIE